MPLRRTLHMAFAFAACALLLPAPAWPAPPTPQEVAETAKWFEDVALPDIRGKSYVEITVGKAFPPAVPLTDSGGSEGGPDSVPDGPKVRGFLLADEADAFTILADGLVTEGPWQSFQGWPLVAHRIGKGRADTPAALGVRSRVIELSQAVDEAIAAVHRPAAKDEAEAPGTTKLARGVALFGLARCCARVGRHDLAGRLDAELLTLDGPEMWGPQSAGRSFRQVVEDGIAHVLLRKAIADCAMADEISVGQRNRLATRGELVTAFWRIARDFPRSADAAEAARMVEVLGRMVDEDKAHFPVSLESLPRLSREEQIGEWIFQWRDLRYFPQRIDEDPGPGPLHELEKLGFTAAPALLALLDDGRPTRTAAYSPREVRFGPIYTYGDCAEFVLSRLAGSGFGFRPNELPAMRDPAKTAERHRAILAWWDRVGKLGEKAALIERVRAGGRDAAAKIARLNEIDPPAAVEAAAAGLSAATDQQAGLALVEALGAIHSDSATAVLRQEAQQGQLLQCRVEAAWALLRQGNGQAVPAMIEEFQRWTPAKYRPAQDGPRPPDDPRRLVSFLAKCGDRRALEALETRLPRLPADLRSLAVTAVSPYDRFEQSWPAESEAVTERMAISALDDRAPIYGWWQEDQEGERVCDAAAMALAAQNPGLYEFHARNFQAEPGLPPSRAERDVLIARLRNVWRTNHGQEALPVPEVPSHPAASGDPNIVAACRWNGLEPLADFPMKVGERLTSATFLAACERLERALPAKYFGFIMTAERPKERRGFDVQVEWIVADRPRYAVADEREPIRFGLVIDRTDGLSSSTGGLEPRKNPAYGQSPELRRLVDAALASDPDHPLQFYFVSRHEGK